MDFEAQAETVSEIIAECRIHVDGNAEAIKVMPEIKIDLPVKDVIDDILKYSKDTVKLFGRNWACYYNHNGVSDKMDGEREFSSLGEEKLKLLNTMEAYLEIRNENGAEGKSRGARLVSTQPYPVIIVEPGTGITLEQTCDIIIAMTASFTIDSILSDKNIPAALRTLQTKETNWVLSVILEDGQEKILPSEVTLKTVIGDDKVTRLMLQSADDRELGRRLKDGYAETLVNKRDRFQ